MLFDGTDDIAALVGAGRRRPLRAARRRLGRASRRSADSGCCGSRRSQYRDFRLKFQFREGRTTAGSPTAARSSASRIRGRRSPSARTRARGRGTRRTTRRGSRSTAVTRSSSTTGHRDEPQKTGSVYNFDPDGDRRDRQAERRRRLERLRDRGRRPALPDLPQRRADQRVRQHAGAELVARRRPADPGPAAVRRRASSASRTTAARTSWSTATSASRTCPTTAPPRGATGPFTVSGTGPHTVEVRSVDAAGQRGGQAGRSTSRSGARPRPAGSGEPPPGDLPPMLDTPATCKLGSLAGRVAAQAVRQARDQGPGRRAPAR